jgi:DNA replication and repair protein RecF
VRISRLILHNFRNYESLDLLIPEGGICLFGENGSGKTNVLEAVHILATGRSHRRATRKEMIFTTAGECVCRGHFFSDIGDWEHVVSVSFSAETASLFSFDDQKNYPIAEWFHRSTIVSFGPEDILLISGSPSERRRFLDMTISQIDHQYLENSIDYHRTLHNRNVLLARSSTTNLELDTYDERLAESGATILTARERFIDQYRLYFEKVYAVIGAEKELVTVSYISTIKGCSEDRTLNKKLFVDELLRHRFNDKGRGFTSVGPHRDDIRITIKNVAVRSFASQGQKRSLAIALKLMALQALEERKKDSLMILLDDAFSELDDQRTQRIFPLIAGRGQLFLTVASMKTVLIHNLPVGVVENGRVTRQ